MKTISASKLRDRILRAIQKAESDPKGLLAALEQKIATMEAGEPKNNLERKLLTMRERLEHGTFSGLDVLVLISGNSPRGN